VSFTNLGGKLLFTISNALPQLQSKSCQSKKVFNEEKKVRSLMVDIVVVKKEKYDRDTNTLFTFYKALNLEYPCKSIKKSLILNTLKVWYRLVSDN